MLSVTYGLSAQIVDTEVRPLPLPPPPFLNEKRQYVAHAEETMKIVSQAMVPGAFLADLFPIRAPLPPSHRSLADTLTRRRARTSEAPARVGPVPEARGARPAHDREHGRDAVCARAAAAGARSPHYLCARG